MKAIVKTAIIAASEAILFIRLLEFRDNMNEEFEIIDLLGKCEEMLWHKDIPQGMKDVEFALLEKKFRFYKKTRWTGMFGWLPLNKNMREVQDFLEKHGFEC